MDQGTARMAIGIVTGSVHKAILDRRTAILALVGEDQTEYGSVIIAALASELSYAIGCYSRPGDPALAEKTIEMIRVMSASARTEAQAMAQAASTATPTAEGSNPWKR